MIKDYTFKFITGKLIKELENNLGEACSNDFESKIWLKKSNKLLNFLTKEKKIKVEEEDLNYINISLKLLYFMRCTFFWFSKKILDFKIEVKEALSIFKEESIFNFLIAISFLPEIICKKLNKEIENKEQLKKNIKIIKNMEYFFSLVEKNNSSFNGNELKDSLIWFRAWFSYKLNSMDSMNLYLEKVNKLPSSDKESSFLFFIRWLSEITDPEDFIILLDNLK